MGRNSNDDDDESFPGSTKSGPGIWGYPDPSPWESFTGTAGVVPAADLEKCQLLKVENFKFNKSYLVPW